MKLLVDCGTMTQGFGPLLRRCRMSFLGRVLSVAVFFVLAVPSLSAESNAIDDPIDFARQRLNDPDAGIRESALEVVASLSPQAERQRLLQALDDPSIYVQATALDRLKDLPLGDDSEKIHSFLEKASPKAQIALAETPTHLDPFLPEVMAVEALLNADDGADRQFAQEYVRSALTEHRSYPRWEMMADLVGKYKLRELEPHLRKHAHPNVHKVITAGIYAKLGNQEAKQILRESLIDEGSRRYIISDSELVRILGLKQVDIEPSLKSDWIWERLAAETALARLGNRDVLRNNMRKLLAGELDVSPEDKHAKTFNTLQAVGELGDESFLPILETYFEKTKDVKLKLRASWAIARIRARQAQSGK